jgi:homoserine dehydrogenase
MVEIANRDEKLKKKHGIEFDVKDKDLKKSKKAKKKEKKKAKKLQEEKEFNRKSEIQRITEEAMDNVVLDTVVGEEDYENFKEYQDDMEDFTFDHIFGKG